MLRAVADCASVGGDGGSSLTPLYEGSSNLSPPADPGVLCSPSFSSPETHLRSSYETSRVEARRSTSASSLGDYSPLYLLGVVTILFLAKDDAPPKSPRMTGYHLW